MRRLENKLQLIESFIPHYNLVDTSVSSASVGWHIEHALLTIRQIIRGVKSSDAGQYKKSLNYKWILVRAFNMIPRGRAKAPNVVVPVNNDLDEAALNNSVAKTRKMLEELAAVADNQFFLHPYFGQLNKKPTISFLVVHTHHHLKIIKDIVAGK